MAQTPETAEHDGMPRSAIATGMVDYVLPPRDMPAQIVDVCPPCFRTHGPQADPAAQGRGRTEETLRAAARANRARLLAVQGGDAAPPHGAAHGGAPESTRRKSTCSYVHENAPEVEALFRDLLIGVTRLLPRCRRVQGAAGKGHLAAVRAHRVRDEAIRVWVCGCSTGEEAYSIAILLQEHMDTLEARRHASRCSPPTSTGRRSSMRAPASIRPASPPMSRPSGWRAIFVDRPGQWHLPRPESASATCWCSPSRT